MRSKLLMHCLKLAFHIKSNQMRCHISFFQTKCLPVELQLNDNPVRCSIDQLCGYLSDHVYNFLYIWIYFSLF